MPARLQQGDRLLLTCNVFKGSTPITIAWEWQAKKGGGASERLPSGVTQPRRIDEFTSIMAVPSLGGRHEGNFSCRASNAAGSAVARAAVAVHGTFRLLSRNLSECGFSLYSLTVPPEIVPFPTSAQVQREGIRTRLLCGLARGDPPITFKWLKNARLAGAERAHAQKGASTAHALSAHARSAQPQQPSVLGGLELESSELLSVTSVDDFSSLLTFVSLRSHHSGNYTCLAVNEAGSAHFTASLTVKGTHFNVIALIISRGSRIAVGLTLNV